MTKRTFTKTHKLLLMVGIIAIPFITPYNWWLIAAIIIIFLGIALTAKGSKDTKKEL